MKIKNSNNIQRENGRNSYTKRRQKIPFNKRKHRNGLKLPQDVIKQNIFRARMSSIAKKLSLVPVKEIGTGVDYKAFLKKDGRKKVVRIDIKFSFGLLGDGIIAARIDNRRLINKADYAFAIDRNNKINIFSINKLKQYVKQNFGSLPTNQRVDRGTHYVYPIKLNDFYNAMKIKPQIVNLDVNGINSALKNICEIEIQSKEQEHFTEPIEKRKKYSIKLDSNKYTSDKRLIIHRIRNGIRGK
ncbi:MAG: hypothetical protein PHP82_00590 [Candidatus ainarchaeum sp.]|nr:hypothetical protein [Candidatus ainarchaeum sp.]